MSRTERFSERDRALLELARPHLANAWTGALNNASQTARIAQLSSLPDLEDFESCREKLCALGVTGREAEVLFWVTQGKTNEEVGMILRLTRGTVKCYVQRLLAKVGCETRTAMARVALEALVSAS